MSPSRPSNPEIHAKVEQALAAIAAGKCQIGPVHHLSDDFDECSIYDEDDLWGKLPILLQEIKAENPVMCYAGTCPPMTAEEPSLDGLELWAYHWNSDCLNGRVYLKFCIKFGRDGKPNYLHARIHPDRPFNE
jgi:hypothetical protein